MSNQILVLEGKEVSLSAEEETLSLSTKTGWALTIYNRYYYVDKYNTNIVKIGGVKVVSHINCREHCVDVIFEDGSLLRIDLSPDSYIGPEAMQLTGPKGEIVVWN
jgi:hypothetical protein